MSRPDDELTQDFQRHLAEVAATVRDLQERTEVEGADYVRGMDCAASLRVVLNGLGYAMQLAWEDRRGSSPPLIPKKREGHVH